MLNEILFLLYFVVIFLYTLVLYKYALTLKVNAKYLKAPFVRTMFEFRDGDEDLGGLRF